MATDPQIRYLRTLGVDPRVGLTDMTKEESSEWITELKGYRDAAGLTPDRPVSVPDLERLHARGDALVLPPTRSVGSKSVVPRATGEETKGTSTTANPAPQGEGPGRSPNGRSDEGWWRLEVAQTLSLEDQTTITLTVGASEHFRHGLELQEVEELGRRVREALERQAGQFRAVAGRKPASG